MDLVSTTRHDPRGGERGRRGDYSSKVMLHPYISSFHSYNTNISFAEERTIFFISFPIIIFMRKAGQFLLTLCHERNEQLFDASETITIRRMGFTAYIRIRTLYIMATRRIHMEAMLGARNTHAVNWNECLVNVWDFRRGKGGRCRFASNISVKSLKF